MKEYKLKGQSKKNSQCEDRQQGRDKQQKIKSIKTTQPNKRGQHTVVEHLSLSSCMKIFFFPRLIPKTVWDIL